MNTKITLALCSAALLFSFSSCQKVVHQLDGTDINYAIKQGYQYDTWVIDDDNPGHADQTEKTVTFTNKQSPTIKIKQDNSYTYTYKDAATNIVVTEDGTVTIDGNAKTITFHPTSKSDYTYKITCLTDENFFWEATVEKMVYVRQPE
ncbi:MAG: hypothetical protein ACXVNR_00995, partial [Bacteroidia bacterium]